MLGSFRKKPINFIEHKRGPCRFLAPPLPQGLRAVGGLGQVSVFRMAKLSIRRIDFWQVGGYPTARDRKTVRLSTAQSPSSRIGHQMSQVDVAQAERYRRTPIGHVGKPLERNPSPRNLFEHVASDVSSSDFDFPIVGVLGGRAITMTQQWFLWRVRIQGIRVGIHWGS